MENSPNSSPEPSPPALKSVFNKPSDFDQAFEVSLDESVTRTKTSRSEVDLEVTSTGANEVRPFKRTRKSLRESFRVGSDETLTSSQLEQSETFVKPQAVFSKKNKSFYDCFDVSYNETIATSQPEASSKSPDESSAGLRKRNLFKKSNETQNISISNESSVGNVTKRNRSNLEVTKNSSTHSLNGNEADSTTFLPKQNPFKKSSIKNTSATQFHLSVLDQNKSTEPEINTNNTNEDDESDSSIVKFKKNIFKQTSPEKNDSVISMTEERRNDISKESAVPNDPTKTSKSLDQSIFRQNKTDSYLEQSSINDDNLNNWMSDQSEDELPAPTVPSVTTRVSQPTKKPETGNSTTFWEEKFNEIKQNAERKSKGIKSNPTSNSPEKRKPLKKIIKNVEKPEEGEDRYRPPKLLKPAPFATKKLYNHIIKKLEPKYGIDTMLESENLVSSICETVKKVTRRKSHQKTLIHQLKKELAKAGLVETTMDFYEFVIKYLPYSFRVKVVPCLQPGTNVVFPPKDVLNPFEKIL